MYTRHGWQKSIGGIWGRGLEDIKPNAKPGSKPPCRFPQARKLLALLVA
jgi:hypothetical protein